MCYVWKNPTNPKHEVSLDTLSKLPDNFDYLNLTGGEPTLRKDLLEICDLLRPKAKTLEISTNGLSPEKLVNIVKKYPDIKIRISLDGMESRNDTIRGEKDGFLRKMENMKKLIDAGGCDLGFGTTFQDENIDQIMEMFNLSMNMKIEYATSALHNAFQFHKVDNEIYNRVLVSKKIEQLITGLLKTKSVKNWFRAYLNLGLIKKILGYPRMHPCTQGTDSIFIDPWSDMYACNVRPDFYVGNLFSQNWDEILKSASLSEVRKKVSQCHHNCWMVSSAKTAMRNRYFPKLPKTTVLQWVLINKFRVSLNMNIPFSNYINYNVIDQDADLKRRISFLNITEKIVQQPKFSNRYSELGRINNH